MEPYGFGINDGAFVPDFLKKFLSECVVSDKSLYLCRRASLFAVLLRLCCRACVIACGMRLMFVI